MDHKKPQLIFKIDGSGVSPETVKLRELFEILFLVEQSLVATAKSAGAKDADDLAVSLVRISDGSNEATLAMSPRMYKAAATISHSLANDDFDPLPVQAQASLRQLWGKAKTRAWTFDIHPNGKGNGVVQASIKPQHEILRVGDISGPTTLFGEVERAGGSARPTAWLRLISGENIVAVLKNTALAEELGARLFKVVGLEGEATWDLNDWKIKKFRADRLTEYQNTDIVTAFENLATVAGDFWDDVDPNEYVAQLRAD